MLTPNGSYTVTVLHNHSAQQLPSTVQSFVRIWPKTLGELWKECSASFGENVEGILTKISPSVTTPLAHNWRFLDIVFSRFVGSISYTYLENVLVSL